MSKKSKDEFQNLIKDIINNENFMELDKELHHGITRFNHSYRVAKGTYKVCKLFKFDYKKATRGALLHDFYLDTDFDQESSRKVFSIHPNMALVNAKNNFEISTLEANIIESHMFPMNKNLPKYKESWVVTCVDKAVAIYEMYRFKSKLALNIYLLFLFNIITLHR